MPQLSISCSQPFNKSSKSEWFLGSWSFDYYNQFNKEHKNNAYLIKLKVLFWELSVVAT